MLIVSAGQEVVSQWLHILPTPITQKEAENLKILPSFISQGLEYHITQNSPYHIWGQENKNKQGQTTHPPSPPVRAINLPS